MAAGKVRAEMSAPDSWILGSVGELSHSPCYKVVPQSPQLKYSPEAQLQKRFQLYSKGLSLL